FNLGLERQLKVRGIPTVHYVSPSVWAWRQGRVRKIGAAADKVLCLLPFEKAFYDKHNVAAEFVGHPLADRIPRNLSASSARAELGINAPGVVTIMPGSRLSEVTRLGPVFIDAAKILQQRFPGMAFVTPLATGKTRALFEQQLARAHMQAAFTLVMHQSEQAIIAGDAVLLASGTAALETALLCRAMVAAYRLAPVTYFLARSLRLVKVRHFTLPNHLTDEPLVPEYLQSAATPGALADAIANLLEDSTRRLAIEKTFASLRDNLARNASARAAEAILGLAREQARR
ncbi:MAG: lipid-A-disaccharide synthase, partial [Woeseia sp.]